MAQDPNKVYYEDKEGNVSEVRKRSRAELDAAYKERRKRFQESRARYNAQGTQPGHAVTSVNRRTGIAE